MGAKVMLTGSAKNIQQHPKTNTVTLTIVTGPAVKNAPKGLNLFGEVKYVVTCSARQWRQARLSEEDDSDLVIEGYQEARQAGGKLYIAVGAMSVQSNRLQQDRKHSQLLAEFEQAKALFAEASQANTPKNELEMLAARLVKARDSLFKYREAHPELTGQQEISSGN
jgi:hypothetical protein